MFWRSVAFCSSEKVVSREKIYHVSEMIFGGTVASCLIPLPRHESLSIQNDLARIKSRKKERKKDYANKVTPICVN